MDWLESNLLKFLHDQVQTACYAMIPQKERDAPYLKTGLDLDEDSFSVVDYSFSVVVNHLRCGAYLLKDQNQRNRMAELLLEASKKATKSAAFITAASHLKLGISLLGVRHWRDLYHLSVALYMTAAEVEYCNGRLDRMDTLLTTTLQNSRTSSDRVRASTMSVYSLGSLQRPTGSD